MDGCPQGWDVCAAYLGRASRVVDGPGDEDAAAAVDDEGAVVVGDGGIGRGGREGERHEGGEQQAAGGGEKGRRHGLDWGHTRHSDARRSPRLLG